MIDERQEELAALYALDLLEGGERLQFETALARDPALQQFVRELRESSASLAHLAPTAQAPAALKQRVLTSIGARPAPPAHSDNVIRPGAPAWQHLLPWAIAACLAVTAAWFGQLYVSSRTETALLRAQQEIADIALKTTRNQLDAERLISTRHVVDLNQQMAETIGKLSEAQRLAADIEQARNAERRETDELRRTLDSTHARLAAAEKSLSDARTQIAALNLNLKSQADLAELKITALASMLNNSPEALAVAVWDPVKQEGILNVEKLPVLAAGQTYEMWVIEDKRPPISAGVFMLGGDGRGRVRFKPSAPVAQAAVFAISREKDDGVRAHATPGEVLVLGQTQ